MFRQLVMEAFAMEIKRLQTQVSTLRQQKQAEKSIFSDNIMKWKANIRKLEAKIIILRKQKRRHVNLNMALVDDKEETTKEIIRLNAVISKLKRSLDSLVKEHVYNPGLKEFNENRQKQQQQSQKQQQQSQKQQQQSQKQLTQQNYKQNYNLIF